MPIPKIETSNDAIQVPAGYFSQEDLDREPKDERGIAIITNRPKEQSNSFWNDFKNWFANSGSQTTMAEAPHIMQAVGYYPNKDFKVVYLPSKGSQQLSDNLAVLGGAGILGLTSTAIPRFFVKNMALPMATGMAIDEASRLLTGTTSTEVISKYLLNKGWSPWLSDFVGGFSNPGYWINPTGKYTSGLLSKTFKLNTKPYGSLTLLAGNYVYPKNTEVTPEVTLSQLVNPANIGSLVVTTNPITSLEDLLKLYSYTSMDNNKWYNNGSTISLGNNGEIIYSPRLFAEKTQIPFDLLSSVLLARNTGTPYLEGLFNGLDDFFVKNDHMFNNLYKFGNWHYAHELSDGTRIPITFENGPENNIGIILGDLADEVYIPTNSLLQVYDDISNYISNINIPSLTKNLLDLIKKNFPNEKTLSYGSSRTFYNPSNKGKFIYYPLDQTFSLRSPGHKILRREPISSLTPELFLHDTFPNIVTSSIPLFSEGSIGINWGKLLGVDPAFNTQIDFGLFRPRPTKNDVELVLGGTFARSGDASLFVHKTNPTYSNYMPYINPPYDIPIIHAGLVPTNSSKISMQDRIWMSKMLQNLSKGAKGVDISPTSDINPTVSRFVSDLKATPNLSDMDRYGILKEFLENPNQNYDFIENYLDYSPHSWLLNTLLGNKTNRFFSEPSVNMSIGMFNSIGDKLPSPIRDLDALGIQNWMQKNTPTLFSMPQDRTKIPFTVTTIKKNGGKLNEKD